MCFGVWFIREFPKIREYLFGGPHNKDYSNYSILGVYIGLPSFWETTILGYKKGLYRGYIGIMEKNMETTIMENQMEKKIENEMETGIIMGYKQGLYRGYIGIMENNMETTIVLVGFRVGVSSLWVWPLELRV